TRNRSVTVLLGDSSMNLTQAWVKFIEESPSNTVTERLRVLKMLQAALRFAPNNPRVVTLIADHVLKSLDEDDTELVTVRNALVNGSSVGIAHFIKGTSALMKKDMKNAELHLELAVELMPRSGAILNNLAVALAMREDPDYERALELSGAAIDLVKTPTPHFYETRGQILFRMGELKEAIPDLERALAEPSLAKKAHEMLANCYDEVGDKELADNHRTAVERLEMIGQE
ncbi:MAG: tetratricopeptide repeat protein, partial [Planctomycetota bacterium]